MICDRLSTDIFGGKDVQLVPNWRRMVKELKQKWRQLKAGKPGHRFQERAERNKNDSKGKSWTRRFVQPIVGALLVVAGVVFCLIPGPGLPLIALGGALLAERSRPVAKVLDWAEVKIRRVASWGKDWWQHSSQAGKVAAMFLLALGGAAAAYGAFRVAF